MFCKKNSIQRNKNGDVTLGNWAFLTLLFYWHDDDNVAYWTDHNY